MAIGTTALALTLLGIGTGISAYGQVRAGQAAKRAGKAEGEAAEAAADLAEHNAEVAMLQAEDAISRGHEAANQFRSEVRGMVGTQRARFAGGNIDVTYGSAFDVQQDARRLGELDMLTLRTNAIREAWGYEVGAADLRKRATIARQTGQYAIAAGGAAQTSYNIAAAGTVIGGAGSLFLTRYGMRP